MIAACRRMPRCRIYRALYRKWLREQTCLALNAALRQYVDAVLVLDVLVPFAQPFSAPTFRGRRAFCRNVWGIPDVLAKISEKAKNFSFHRIT